MSKKTPTGRKESVPNMQNIPGSLADKAAKLYETGNHYRDAVPTKCAYCGKEFEESDYGILCRAIMRHKPVCGYICNKALGQVK